MVVERDIWECAGGGGSGASMSLSSIDLSDLYGAPLGGLPGSGGLIPGLAGGIEASGSFSAATEGSPAVSGMGRFGPMTVESVDLALDEVRVSVDLVELAACIRLIEWPPASD